MPNYCTAGQSARVFFQYPGQSQDNVSVVKSPVAVTTTIESDPSTGVPFTGGQCPQLYTVRAVWDFWDKALNRLDDTNTFFRQNMSGPFISFALENPVVGTESHGLVITHMVNGVPFRRIDNYGNYLRYESRNLRNIEIIPQGFEDNCGNRSFSSNCRFTVRDADGILRFEKIASTCPEYQVVCGGNCPPGTVECCGCCLPCDSTAASIRALTNQVRSL